MKIKFDNVFTPNELEILYNKLKEIKPAGVGSAFLLDSGLCVIAQIEHGMAKLISIRKNNFNRNSDDNTVKWGDTSENDTYHNISDEKLIHLFGGPEKFVEADIIPVDLEIKVTPKDKSASYTEAKVPEYYKKDDEEEEDFISSEKV